MAKKRLEKNENIFAKHQKIKMAEEILQKYEAITLSDICVVSSTLLPKQENYNPTQEAVEDNPPNLIPSPTNNAKSSTITEEKNENSVNNGQKEEELNTQRASKSDSTKSRQSSKNLTEELLLEKERILAFFEANKERGITRAEVTTYLNVREYRTAKRKIKALGIQEVLKYVVDLRSSISIPIGLPIYPADYMPVDMIEDNQVIPKQDESSSTPDENTSTLDEDDSTPYEDNLTLDEDTSEPDEETSTLDEDSSTPAEDNLMPAEDDSTPVEDNLMPAEDNSTPAEDNIMPAEDDSTPVEDNLMPAEDDSTPAEDNIMPAEDNSTPYEDNSTSDENDIQKKEASKNVVDLKTQSSKKNNDNKSVLLLSELFGVHQKTQNYIIGLDLFNQRLNVFLEFLDELISQERIPCFWLWESDLIELDKLKEENSLARHLIKFFAQDENGYYSRLVDGPKPKNMIEFCKKNDITLITGIPIDILNFKLEGAKVRIPNFYKNLFPSPFDLKGKVLGFDSCVAFLKKEDIIPLLSGAKTILLSDVQVREIPNNSYILKLCAYYGKVKKAEPHTSGIADQTIVKFYKTNVVDMVYTMDSGFMMFAKFAKIHCEFIKDKSGVTSSKIFEKIDSIFSGEFKFDKIEQKKVRYDIKVNTYDGRFRIYTDSLVSVYSKNKYKRTSLLPYIEVYKDDYVIIRKSGKVLVSIVTNPNTAMGRILFFGLESNLPKEFKNFN